MNRKKIERLKEQKKEFELRKEYTKQLIEHSKWALDLAGCEDRLSSGGLEDDEQAKIQKKLGDLKINLSEIESDLEKETVNLEKRNQEIDRKIEKKRNQSTRMSAAGTPVDELEQEKKRNTIRLEFLRYHTEIKNPPISDGVKQAFEGVDKLFNAFALKANGERREEQELSPLEKQNMVYLSQVQALNPIKGKDEE